MTTFPLTTSSSAATTAKSAGFITGFAARVLAEVRARRAARSVEMLTDEGLHDIGISRSEIDSAVRFGRHHRF